jgi:diketogulonate reductase-like aldo/keto reductase
MNEHNREHKAITMPSFIYGTAWKETATTDLTCKAISTGFRGIDTAGQPKHYQEALIGKALTKLSKEGIPRETLFVQTKFTPPDGQDHRIPYDPSKDLRTQVKQSFGVSLKNLGTDYIDSYLLHGPYSRFGLGDSDWKVWQAMSELYQSGQVGMIGISNVDIRQLKELTDQAEIKPKIVQNRCFAHMGWDLQVRQFCQENEIIYQGFSLLTANWYALKNPGIAAIAQRYKKTPAQVIFRFAIQAGMFPLTGTTDEQHMKEDLHVFDFRLEDDEVKVIESIGV